MLYKKSNITYKQQIFLTLLAMLCGAAIFEFIRRSYQIKDQCPIDVNDAKDQLSMQSSFRRHLKVDTVKATTATASPTLPPIPNQDPKFKPLPLAIGVATTKRLNKLRSDVNPTAANMPELVYNFTVQQQYIDPIIVKYGPEWLFQQSGNPVIIKQGWNIYYIPLPPGWRFGWLDTCKNPGFGCINENLNFREAQTKHCFVYSDCNTTAFNNFRTCLKDPDVHGGGEECSYAFDYGPLWVYDQIEEIAGAVLDAVGPGSPADQHNSYIMFMKTKIPKPLSDRPYMPGESCEKCKPCENRLCLN